MIEAYPIIKPDIKLRWYQEELFDDILSGKSRKVIYVAPRRSGKDTLGFIIGIYQALMKTCLIYHVLPKRTQARRCVFDAINDYEKRFLDFIPKEAIRSINKADMVITLHNNSQIHILGGDTYDTSLVGTNPYGIILSEYALMNPNVFSYVRPIIASNRGWCLIISTPRGKNHLYHLFETAKKLPDWKVVLQKTSEIQHIPEDVLASERAQMDEELYLQEYECDFNRGVTGSWYMNYLDTARMEGRITHVPYDPGLVVHAVFDIGVNDPTTIIWFQVTDSQNSIRIIDCYSNKDLGMDHYARVLQDKKYRMGSIFAPHDIKVREFGAGAVTRYEQARQLGVEFTLVDQVPIVDGIENAWRHFGKVWIDESKCRSLIDALENYRKEWNEQQQMHLPRPVKSWACFTADTLVITLDGFKKIVDITDNDAILTDMGWERCTNSFIVRKKADLVELTFNDGSTVRCTPDHLFRTYKGWIYAEYLTEDVKIDRVEPYITNKPLRCINIKYLDEKEDVYCITVPFSGYFSLFNGAIVKNCHYADAFRYLFLTLHKTQRGMTYEEYERERAIALLSNKNPWGNAPNPFGIPFGPNYDQRIKRY